MKAREYIQETVTQTSALGNLRCAITAMLVLIPGITAQSEIIPAKEMPVYKERHTTTNPEREQQKETRSHETVFKDGIKRALSGVNDINQIPLGGLKINYYGSVGERQGKPIPVEMIKTFNLPERFDISPRKIGKPLSSMVLVIGDRRFDINPDLGNIQRVYLTPESLVIETTMFIDITYDKQEELPRLLYKLWSTPKGKGKKSGFRGTTVTEL